MKMEDHVKYVIIDIVIINNIYKARLFLMKYKKLSQVGQVVNQIMMTPIDLKEQNLQKKE